MKRRRFADAKNQTTYDNLRKHPITDAAELRRVRSMNSAMDAYCVGFTLPKEPPRRFPRGSQAYAAWAAGVDNTTNPGSGQ
jgi:hypothetical protein